MDFALQSALLGAVMGSVVLAVSAFYGWLLSPNDSAYGWWGAGLVADALSKLLLLLHSDPWQVASSDLTGGVAAVLMLFGALSMLGQRITGPLAGGGLAAAGGWTAMAHGLRTHLHVPDLPLPGAAGLAFLLAAWAIFRRRRTDLSDADRLGVLVFALTGLHQLTAPALLSHTASATWTFILSQFLSMVLAVSLLLMVLRRQQAAVARQGQRAEQLGDALAGIAEAVALYDAQGRLQTSNQRYRDILALGGDGLAPNRELQLADGRWVIASILETKDGGRMWIVQDITSRRQAEQSMQDSLLWLKGVMDTVPDGIVTIDQGGGILSCNQGAQRIFGYGASEVVGRNVTMLMPAPDRTDHDDHLARYRAEGRRVQGMRKDGSLFPLELSVSEMRQGGEITFIGVLRDITDRKRDEDALAAQSTLRQAIIDNMGHGVAVFDGQDRLIACNAQALSLLGLPDQAAMAHLQDILLHLTRQGEFGQGKGSAMAQANRRLARLRRDPNQIFEHIRPNGIAIEVHSTTMPGGGLILTMADVTGRKKIEDTLRDARDAAERGNRTKATFLANISHELRTPLNAIIGFSELMTHEMMGPIQPAAYRSYIDDIHDSGQHLLALINDILDMSKAEAGMTDLDETTVDVGQLIANTLRMLGNRAATAGIALTADLPAALPCLHADQRRLRQILLNLVSNAVKFTERDGRVIVTAQTDQDGFYIRVADTGIGMTADEMERVMEPFVQADSRLSRKYEGSGLGLPLSRAMIQAHGGRMVLDSRPEQGTVVTITLPPWRILPPVAQPPTADMSRYG